MTRVRKEREYSRKTKMQLKPRFLNIQIIVTTILLSILIFPASASSVVSVELVSQEVHAGDDFEIYINITPSTAIAGAQLDLKFDSSVITVTNVEEGDFFDRNSVMSIFIPGTFDNQQGLISGLFAVTLGQAVIESPGNFAHITFTACDQAGESSISLSNVIISDASGNEVPVTVENSQVIVIGTSTTDTTEDASASSGGGGGGGGGDTGESTDNIELKEVNKLYITGNSDVTYNFDDSNNPVKTISYTSLKNAGFISSTIEILKDVSTTVSYKPEGLVYRNMNIWIGKAGYATESNMENMKISFAVHKKWVQVNNVKTTDIRLNRYHDNEWQILETEMTGEDNDFYFFEAKTPGFSPFAITADVASKNVTENEQINAASSYDDNDPVEQIEESELERVTDVASTSMSDKVSSAKLSQNSALVLFISISVVLFLQHRKCI
ncbi:cohesin domain-containing protein [Methanolobus tindarius DSM 2278]|uniref:Cohesin domain-containing protein n=1 Tax=Methanolobus tindarius DSM 2278 TaxID=1090322 RepID=W9DNU7_METTI|nr:PGF-pre-PGF domain-containing protein [Methanolobus tindarius]ETA66693.1 cohesin domain-containing protein [Methanolobus tindarius DSM 2278]